ncbi:hypothetical protein [Sphaerotilus montanus]|uniref:Uncharacterized protein n=2 Tax=Sphaerotilus montanus TaxID=522889 RepID=A0A7Y9QXY9_9BURK|nr:hypothetical protein [Sphaerotilus montanus]NYG33501.1 hypothetical protein [Sphaerotilus montanus]
MAFDTTVIQSNVAAKYSILSLINQQNYESVKQSGSATILGYFEGGFDEFKQKRSQLESLLFASGSFSLDQGFYRHALSSVGAQAYAECIARQGNKPIAAWIANKSADGIIAVTVKSGVTGNATVVYTVDGSAKPMNQPAPLSAGSSQTLLFARDPSKAFLIAVNAINQATQATDSAVIELPRMRNFEVASEEKIISTSLMCAAGCQGNTAGCRIMEPGKIVAPTGYAIDRNTLREVGRRTRFGPGSKNIYINWVDAFGSDGGIQSIDGQIQSCEGNSPHTQGATELTFEARAIRKFVREVVK